MKKIPSLFVRNFDGDPRLVRCELTPGCDWVLRNEGAATLKRDGTACLVDECGKLFRRYDAKGGKIPPEGFVPAQEPDPKTGHWPGWIPVGDGPQDRWYRDTAAPTEPGTYELCGPKFQTNAEGLDEHLFFRHGSELVGAPSMTGDVAVDFDLLRSFLGQVRIEGIVWHHPDGRMVKIKRADFGLRWPP
jgi:hypothetical protein